MAHGRDFAEDRYDPYGERNFYNESQALALRAFPMVAEQDATVTAAVNTAEAITTTAITVGAKKRQE